MQPHIASISRDDPNTPYNIHYKNVKTVHFGTYNLHQRILGVYLHKIYLATSQQTIVYIRNHWGPKFAFFLLDYFYSRANSTPHQLLVPLFISVCSILTLTCKTLSTPLLRGGNREEGE